MLGAVRAAKELAANLDPMADDLASAVCASRCHRMYRALETVKDQGAALRAYELKDLIILIAGYVAFSHGDAPLLGSATPSAESGWSRSCANPIPKQGVPSKQPPPAGIPYLQWRGPGSPGLVAGPSRFWFFDRRGSAARECSALPSGFGLPSRCSTSLGRRSPAPGGNHCGDAAHSQNFLAAISAATDNCGRAIRADDGRTLRHHDGRCGFSCRAKTRGKSKGRKERYAFRSPIRVTKAERTATAYVSAFRELIRHSRSGFTARRDAEK